MLTYVRNVWKYMDIEWLLLEEKDYYKDVEYNNMLGSGRPYMELYSLCTMALI